MKQDNTSLFYVIDKSQLKTFSHACKTSESYDELIIQCDILGFNKVLLNGSKSFDGLDRSNIKKDNLLLIPYKHTFRINSRLRNKSCWTLTPWVIINVDNDIVNLVSLYGLETKSFYNIPQKTFDENYAIDTKKPYEYKDSDVRKYLNTDFINNFNINLINNIYKEYICESDDIVERIQPDYFYLPSVSNFFPDVEKKKQIHNYDVIDSTEQFSIRIPLEVMLYSSNMTFNDMSLLTEYSTYLTRSKPTKRRSLTKHINKFVYIITMWFFEKGINHEDGIWKSELAWSHINKKFMIAPMFNLKLK